MTAVHLHVVELEGDGERALQPTFAVAAPHHHRIAELVGVLVDDAVEFGGRHRRCAHSDAGSPDTDLLTCERYFAVMHSWSA